MSCSVDGCTTTAFARSWCKRHYSAWVRNGSTNTRRYTSAHIEDVEWMAETGETWFGACRRLEVKPKTLEKLLLRKGRADLVAVLRGRCAA